MTGVAKGLGLISAAIAGFLLMFMLLVLFHGEEVPAEVLGVFLVFAVIGFILLLATAMGKGKAAGAVGPAGGLGGFEGRSMGHTQAGGAALADKVVQLEDRLERMSRSLRWMEVCGTAQGSGAKRRCVRPPGHKGKHRYGTLEDIVEAEG